MTRLIAQAGGRRLAVPPGKSTRPTSDRTREGLFGTIHSLWGPLDGARVLDLYAGSGAVGLEALSKGAARALFAESSPRAARVIQANIDALGLPGAELVTEKVERLLAAPPPGHEPFDVVFADPPYALAPEDLDAVLQALQDHQWLAGGALLAVERSTRSQPPAWPAGCAGDRSRRYGEATLWYGLATGA